MKYFRQILIIIFTVFYLFLSTGVLLYRTHCECSGSDRVSLFAATKICNEIISDDAFCEYDNSCENCIDSQEHHSCGCDSPIITYLKLTDHFTNDSHLEYPFTKQIFLKHFSEAVMFSPIVLSSEPLVYPEYSPPQNPFYGRFFINYTNQRKIALVA